MCSTEQAVEILGEVCRVCDQVFERKISDACLYGSYARGDHDEDSDVDILLTVDVEPEELPPYRKNVSADEKALSENGKIDPAKPDALIFDQFQTGYYYVSGEKVGQAWNAGKDLMKK